MKQQANLERFGVSDHAMVQFRARISRLDKMSARHVIRGGIHGAVNRLALQDVNTPRGRTRRPFPSKFRAYCVFDHERGHFRRDHDGKGRQQRDTYAQACAWGKEKSWSQRISLKR
jgi:hypothetical protein